MTVFLVLFNTISCTLSIDLSLTFYTQLSWLSFSLQVASVVGRAELVSCIFFLLSFLSYAHAIKMWPSTKQSLFLFLSICLAFLSILSKEQGITILGVCIAYDVLLHWPWRKSIDNSRASKMNGHFKEETHKQINQGVFSNKELLAVGKRLGVLSMHIKTSSSYLSSQRFIDCCRHGNDVV